MDERTAASSTPSPASSRTSAATESHPPSSRAYRPYSVTISCRGCTAPARGAWSTAVTRTRYRPRRSCCLLDSRHHGAILDQGEEVPPDDERPQCIHGPVLPGPPAAP